MIVMASRRISFKRRIKIIGLISSLLLLMALMAATRPSEARKERRSRHGNSTSSSLDATDCGAHRTRRGHNRIAAGYQAIEGEFPSFAFVKFFSRFSFLYGVCGGTIISDRAILTTRSCFYVDNPVKIRVSIGSMLFDKMNDYPVEEYCIEPDFDLAVLKMREPISFSNKLVQPACLPSSDIFESTEDTQFHIVGPGDLSGDPEIFAASLQVLPVIRATNCSEYEQYERLCFVANNPDYNGIVCQGEFMMARRDTSINALQYDTNYPGFLAFYIQNECQAIKVRQFTRQARANRFLLRSIWPVLTYAELITSGLHLSVPIFIRLKNES